MEFSVTWAERLRWRGLALLEMGARAGLGDRIVAQLAADLGRVDDEFAPYSSWLAAEFTRAHPRALRQAGNELRRFDARGDVARLDLPCSVVLTEQDSLVPPHRQAALAVTADATVHRLDADHDAPVSDAAAFAAAIGAAVESIDLS